MKEELLNEEETLKLLKINKAQLENYVKEGKLSPLYQESVRKFKLSDISKITVEPSSPKPQPPPDSSTPPHIKKEEPSFIKTQKEGSTRVIEAPTETTKIGVVKTGTKGSTFEADNNTEKFLKPLKKAASSQGSLPAILLVVALVISAFSIVTLTFTLQGNGLTQINKAISSIGAILPIDKQQSEDIENQANSAIRSAQQAKTKADNLIKETEEFIGEKN